MFFPFLYDLVSYSVLCGVYNPELVRFQSLSSLLRPRLKIRDNIWPTRAARDKNKIYPMRIRPHLKRAEVGTGFFFLVVLSQFRLWLSALF